MIRRFGWREGREVGLKRSFSSPSMRGFQKRRFLYWARSSVINRLYNNCIIIILSSWEMRGSWVKLKGWRRMMWCVAVDDSASQALQNSYVSVSVSEVLFFSGIKIKYYHWHHQVFHIYLRLNQFLQWLDQLNSQSLSTLCSNVPTEVCKWFKCLFRLCQILNNKLSTMQIKIKHFLLKYVHYLGTPNGIS